MFFFSFVISPFIIYRVLINSIVYIILSNLNKMILPFSHVEFSITCFKVRYTDVYIPCVWDVSNNFLRRIKQIMSYTVNQHKWKCHVNAQRNYLAHYMTLATAAAISGMSNRDCPLWKMITCDIKCKQSSLTPTYIN